MRDCFSFGVGALPARNDICCFREVDQKPMTSRMAQLTRRDEEGRGGLLARATTNDHDHNHDAIENVRQTRPANVPVPPSPVTASEPTTPAISSNTFASNNSSSMADIMDPPPPLPYVSPEISVPGTPAVATPQLPANAQMQDIFSALVSALRPPREKPKTETRKVSDFKGTETSGKAEEWIQ